MQVTELPKGGQLSLKGNVVNVPVNVMPAVTTLPRHIGASETIAVKLKKKLKKKSHVYIENVRPQKVFEALQWLTSNG
ncbi:hypothetical protein HOLleu_10974 [Holothuria leucospilota]|uniref:DUF6570 domain-containing protein n=1 Tax=Holothuria leucospilota TaxID=206669 RepID=A0A9Q1HG36_HOLLE|nr:hypothetical protein HOLleu_10974 [Holothuria leucospilota]